MSIVLVLMPPALWAAQYEVAQQHPRATDEGPGTPATPWKTLSKAAAVVGPGDRVVVRGGIYREHTNVKTGGTAQKPIRFEAAPGERVVLTGADRLTGWTRASGESPVYSVAWPHRFITHSRTMTHPDDNYHRTIGRAEQVFVNGYALRQVLSAAQLAPGTFFADVDNKRLHVWDSANGDLGKTLVEASVRPEILRVEGAHVHVRGVHFRYAANMAQHGAVLFAGAHGVMQDCVIEETNASGATFQGESLVVRRCTFRNNGQLGFGACRAHHLLFTECTVEGNNTKNFSRGWEAGGNKLVLCRGAVLEKSRFLRNRGHGVWFDIGNDQCVVRRCLIADNEDAGIFYEISYGLHAHDNVIVGNGFAQTAGAWGAQAGISISSSPHGVIARNLIIGNREGFNFREQMRTTPTIENREERAVWNHDHVIRHNVIAWNRDAQIWGWFDVKDGRHWPADSAGHAVESPDPPVAKPGDLAAGYESDDNRDRPTGLSLAKLNIRFESNAYFAATGQGVFKWGTAWGGCRQYATLSDFQSALGIDRSSTWIEPAFMDAAARDLRLRPDAAACLRENHPRDWSDNEWKCVMGPSH